MNAEPPNPYAPRGRARRYAPWRVRFTNALQYAAAEYRRNVRRQNLTLLQQFFAWFSLGLLMLFVMLFVLWVILLAVIGLS